MVRVSRLQYPVASLGPGRRFVLWLQGCTLACPGCVSRDTWDPTAGDEFPADDLAQLWATALADGAEGLTVSGGEPLQQAEALAELLGLLAARTEAAGRTGEVDTLMYTGYEYAELAGLGPASGRAVGSVDALITGRFRAAEPTELIWRGSANQQLVPRTALGRARYGRYAGSTDAAARLEVSVDDEDVRLVGIPRRGDLSRIERELREAGVGFGSVSWRP